MFFLDAKILLDSGGEIIQNHEYYSGIDSIPFKLYVEGKEYVDDENLNVSDFIRAMRESSQLSRSACPSPQDFLNKFAQFKTIFVVTISAALSGSFNSAQMAKKLYLEENPDANVHIFDSKSASIGETLIALKIKECLEKGFDFSTVVKKVDEYIASQTTYFIAESLDNLIKNGRISKLKGRIVTALNIKPIMGSTPEGKIQLLKKARGGNRAVQALADIVRDLVHNEEDIVLAISHCENLERAELLKKEIEKRCNFKEILILPTRGLSGLYVDYKGIIMAF